MTLDDAKTLIDYIYASAKSLTSEEELFMGGINHKLNSHEAKRLNGLYRRVYGADNRQWGR